MNNSRTLTVALLATLLWMAAAQGSDETIVVTGTRIPTAIEEFAGSVTSITRQDIELRQYRNIADVLTSVPGLYVAPSGGAGAQTSVFIRGTESNHVMVLIDGVEMADPRSGSFAFEHLQLNDVERVEVLRGPYSAQYGSEALGGVINIITRRGGGTPSAQMRIESGSFATHSGSGNFSGQVGRVDFSIGGGWLQTDGQSFTPQRLRGDSDGERDGYDNLDVKIAAGFDIDDASRVDFNFGYIEANTEYDSGFIPFESDALESSVYLRRYSLSWSGDYLQSFWRPFLQGSYYSSLSDGSDQTKARSDRSKIEWRNDFSFSDSMKLIAGVEAESEGISTGKKHSARTNAFYLQAWLQPLNRLSLSGGWRNDDLDDFGSDRNWQVSARYALDKHGSGLHMSYGTAFKAPTLEDRFGFGGNPQLAPESSHSLEFGVEHKAVIRDGALELGWGGTWFDNEIQDLISYDFISMRLENIQSAQIEGLEIFAFSKSVSGIDLRVDATFMRAHDIDRRRLLRRPSRKVTFEAIWLGNPNWTLSAQVDYIGPRPDVKRDDFQRVTKGGYSLLGVTGRYRLAEDMAVFARVDNLLDRDHEPVDGFAGRGVEMHAGLQFSL